MWKFPSRGYPPNVSPIARSTHHKGSKEDLQFQDVIECRRHEQLSSSFGLHGLEKIIGLDFKKCQVEIPLCFIPYMSPLLTQWAREGVSEEQGNQRKWKCIYYVILYKVLPRMLSQYMFPQIIYQRLFWNPETVPRSTVQKVAELGFKLPSIWL